MKYLPKQFLDTKRIKWLLSAIILFLVNFSFAQHFSTVWSNNPYLPMNIIVDSAFLDGGNLQLNDEIAVFDVGVSGNELCVGVIAMVGEFTPDTNYIVIASTDDPTTPEMDGFIVGHTIIYRYWDDSEAEEYVLVEASYNSGFSIDYQSQGTAIAELNGYAALTWTGTSNNSWNNIANWSLTRLPDTATNVVIPTGLTNYPTLSAAGECKDLTIQSNNVGDASILGDNLLTIDRNTIVERYTSGGKWHDIAAPVTAQTVHSVYMNGAPKVWLAHYNEPTDTRTYVYNLFDPMDPGAGFELWVEGGNDATFKYSGPLQTNDLSLNSGTIPPISFSDPAHGYNLIGNPFASPLDWDVGTWNLTDIEGTIWIWDPASGSYKDRSGGIGSLTDGIIPIGQGFFVHATANTASITIPVDARVHSSQAYYKNSEKVAHIPNYFSIKAIKGERNDELNIVFSGDASEEYDNGRDARKMFANSGNAPQIYSLQSNEVLSINGLPLLSEEGRTVKLHYLTGISGEQTLVAKTAFLPNTIVVLEDLFTDIRQNLVDNPVYTFESLVGDEPDRFLLHFGLAYSGIDDQDNNNHIYIYTNDGVVYIRSEGEASKEQKELVISDLLGRTVLKTTLFPAVLSKVPISKSYGYLIVRVKSESRIKTAKVFIH